MTWDEIASPPETRALLTELGLNDLFASQEQPGEKDRAVAWEVLVELRTRISTQPLHFLDGDEESALTSLYNLFQPSRDLLKKNGPDCFRAGTFVEAVLNKVIRPFTAKWHRLKLAGELQRDDLCRELRRELRFVQEKLCECETVLQAIAGAVAPTRPAQNQRSGDVFLGNPISYDKLLFLNLPRPGDTDEQIVKKEKEEIEFRRLAVGLPNNSSNPVGLAISGGGIRSATFALGVVQGLVGRGIFKQVDFLSTVSGGGYLGAFFSSMLNTNDAACGPTKDKVPFKPDLARDSAPDLVADSAATRALRNNSRYMMPSSFWRWLSTLGQAAYGIISNLIIMSTLVISAVLLTQAWMTPCLPQICKAVQNAVTDAPPPCECPTCSDCGEFHVPLSSYTKSLWAIAACGLFLTPIVQRFGRVAACAQKFSRVWERATIACFFISLAATLINYLPWLHYSYMYLLYLTDDALITKTEGWSLSATWVLLTQFIGLVMARGQWLAKLTRKMPTVGRVIFTILWMAGPALLVFVYFEICRSYFTDPCMSQVWIPIYEQTISPDRFFFGLLIAAGTYALFVNVNLTSLHRYYRNCLAETYLLRHVGEGKVKAVESLRLSNLRDKPGAKAPYHLINAALNLPSSKVAELRGRDCDFFLFSKHFCGSPVTGYHATSKWEATDRHLDLGTAVAISGAAAAPQMGMASIRGASFLLTMFNVRLGYWLRQPRGGFADNLLTRLTAAPCAWYLFREALSWMTSDARYLNVTDGGHLENLGLYELLRRRSRFIIAIDGECDPGLDFPSLMRLQQFAAIDMNIRIELDVSRLRRGKFQPSPTKNERSNDDADQAVASANVPGYSRSHFAVGRIHYPDGDLGWLVYIKLSITGNEPSYILDYLRRYPEFPHQSTADQIFEEDQFEAYRRLGEHIADDLFSSEILSRRSIEGAAAGDLAVIDWYQDLANSFFRS